ncbi:tetraspanin-6-like isoform X3 [Bolinopsis microptera]|uniref:tetraspanin-6-like isoform X3 n=1 Tax=Bolinopsis microptera TaxID=2820187 RepID=UPI003079AF15
MASEDRGCCDKCAKLFIMMINIVIVIVGGAILAAGIYWQLSPTGFYKEVFNHNIFNVPIISIVIGSLLLLVGLCGFIGACCEAMFLLKAYMGFLIVIMLMEIVVAVGCVAMKSSVESYATTRTQELIGYYGDEDKDEADIIKETIDLIQENFDCCGVDGPNDWSSLNADFKDQTNGDIVPNSCCKEANRDDDTCGSKADYRTNDEINSGGCKTSMMNFVENNMLYVGIVAGVIVILQVAITLTVSSLVNTVSREEHYIRYATS